MSSFSTTTVREQDLPFDVETDPTSGLVLIYSRWHGTLASAFPFSGPSVTLGRDASNTVSIPDQGVSRHHARFERRADGRTWVVDCRSTNGTHVNGRRVDEHPLREHDVVRVGDALFRYGERRIYAHSPYGIDGSVVSQARPFMHQLERASLVGGYQLDALLDQVAKLAPSNIGIVIHGESGTGKELFARAIHQRSARPGPLVAVNCGAIPADLVESELFGHRRGAFTGASADHTGLVRAADGGTLFLDEIGDLPLPAQVKLLRVLQERYVVPVGDTRAIAVDIRVVCASHRDLESMVAAGEFRGDLFARLRDFTLRLPALRERREDLYSLVMHFAGKFGRPQPQVSKHFMIAVAQHDWPFNLRELESAIRVAVTLSEGEPLDYHHLPESVRQVSHRPVLTLAPPPATALATARQPPASKRAARPRGLKPTADQLRAELVRKRGNIAAVARACGVHRMQLYRWLKGLQLDPSEYR